MNEIYFGFLKMQNSAFLVELMHVDYNPQLTISRKNAYADVLRNEMNDPPCTT